MTANLHISRLYEEKLFSSTFYEQKLFSSTLCVYLFVMLIHNAGASWEDYLLVGTIHLHHINQCRGTARIQCRGYDGCSSCEYIDRYRFALILYKY